MRVLGIRPVQNVITPAGGYNVRFQAIWRELVFEHGRPSQIQLTNVAHMGEIHIVTARSQKHIFWMFIILWFSKLLFYCVLWYMCFFGSLSSLLREGHFIVFSTFVVFVLLPRDCCQTCQEILDIHFGTTLQHFCSRCVSPGNPKPSFWDNTPSVLLTVWCVQLYFWATFHHLCCVFVICWPACTSKISPESGSP